MRRSSSQDRAILNLRAAELVEVRSEAEILSTLDANGRLDALPFMPEMLTYCGRQFRVYKRADKTCDTINSTPSGRWMRNTVHLDDLRCDGSAHGGCQARCLLFWKEAWLKRVQPHLLHRIASRVRDLLGQALVRAVPSDSSMTRDLLMRTTRVSCDQNGPEEEIYSCQATELLKASAPLPWWDLRQYFRDLWSGNTSLPELLNAVFFQAFQKTLKLGGYRAQIWTYNRFQRMCGGTPYPFRSGTLTKTPTEESNLQPGDLVQVKTHDEILGTLGPDNKNRGLRFDVEMVPFCGGKYRVLQRVERIVNERTGRMSRLPGVCIMLEGVQCRSLYSYSRINCPRSIYSYWREIWLRRLE